MKEYSVKLKGGIIVGVWANSFEIDAHHNTTIFIMGKGDGAVAKFFSPSIVGISEKETKSFSFEKPKGDKV